MASAATKPDQGVRPLTTTRTEDEEQPRCTKKTYEEYSALDSVMCPEHRDQKRRSNENFAKTHGKTSPHIRTQKRKPGRPSTQPAQPKNPVVDIGTTVPASEAGWGEWKTGLLAQLADAEEKLILKLTNVQAAKASIEAR